MADLTALKVGDRVRIVAVPNDMELLPSENETVVVLTWMVGKEFSVQSIDCFGNPWLDVSEYPDPSGALHSIALFDTDSWTLV